MVPDILDHVGAGVTLGDPLDQVFPERLAQLLGEIHFLAITQLVRRFLLHLPL